MRALLPILLLVAALPAACNRPPADHGGSNETIAGKAGLDVLKAKILPPEPEPVPPPAPVTAEDYARQTMMLGLYSQQAAAIALDRAQSDDVRRYARRLRSMADELLPKLRAIAKTEGISLPEKLDKPYRDRLQALRTTDDFNRVFLNQQGDAMTDVLTLNQKYALQGTNAALRSHADEVSIELGRQIEWCHRLAIAHAEAPQE